MYTQATTNIHFVPYKFGALTLTLWLWFILAACTPGEGNGPGYAGDQDDVAPIAKATVVGFPINVSSGNAIVRAGSQIIVTAKDSDGIDDPLLSFAWSAEMINSSEAIPFAQEINSAIVFVAPSTGIAQGAADIVVTLTVTDSDGVSTTDTLNIDVNPILDTNNYLVQANRDGFTGVNFEENVFIKITNSDVNNAQNFSLAITPSISWDNLDGIQINAEGNPAAAPQDPFKNIFSFNTINATVAAGSTFLLKLPVPLLDADEINNMPGRIFTDRLELEKLDTASFDLAFVLTDATGVNDLNIELTDSSGAALPLNLNLTVSVNDIRNSAKYESSISASEYYDCIDPDDSTTAFNTWLSERGFNSLGIPGTSENDAHAIYVNNYDLGFGRNMYMRKVPSTNDVFSYVVNHPDLQSTVEFTNAFAVVAMDYTESFDCATKNNVNPTPISGNKSVQFYAFVQDTVNGGYKRVDTMNFDGRGERAIPGACTSCHGGGATDLGFSSAGAADLNSTFMPWDLDSFLYTSASQTLPDPSYNPADINPLFTSTFTFEAQQNEFRKLNQLALNTYINEIAESSASTNRFKAPIELINGWYGNSSCDVTATGITNCTTITGEFDGSFTQGQYTSPTGSWNDSTALQNLYHNVYARNCRMCHTQLSDNSLNFDTYSEFIESSPATENRVDTIANLVYEQGRMPLARLTADRFWLDTVGTSSLTAAEELKSHLTSLTINPANNITEPGLPKAVINVAPSAIPINLTPNTSSTIELSGKNSLFADIFNWEVRDPSNALLTLVDASAPNIIFNPAIPGDYSVTLFVTNNDNLISTNAATTVTIFDRLPALSGASPFITVLPAGYNAGDDLAINLNNFIANVGDPAANFTIESNLSGGAAGVLNLNALSSGLVTFEPTLPAADINDSFTFRLTDADGDFVEGVVDIVIDASSTDSSPPSDPTNLLLSNITTTTVDLDWTESVDNVGVSHYEVTVKDGTGAQVGAVRIFNSNIPRPIEIQSLTPRTAYTFEVVAVDAVPNRSNALVSSQTTTLTSFANNVFGIIETKRGGSAGTCSGCHSVGVASGGFSVEGDASTLFNELKGLSDTDSRVDVLEADDILECVNDGCNANPANPMSDGDAIDFSAAETTIISDWLTQGALNN